MIQRLIDYYHRALPGSSEVMSDLWRTITQQFHTQLVEALEAKDPVQVEAALRNMVGGNALFGVGGGDTETWDSSYSQFLLQRLAQRMGRLPLHNPEQPSDNWKLIERDRMKSLIEGDLWISLDCPLSCFGYQQHQGYATRYLFYCAALFTVRSLRGVPLTILEIGAGLGWLGLIAWRLNRRSYTVIDLPVMSVLSAWFLSQTIGPENVWLWGEEEQPTFARFYPSTQFHEIKSRYNLIYNSDSLPEMPPAIRQEYLTFIESHLSPHGWFHSINHESDVGGQGRVFASAGKLRLIYRAPFMMREGYIEEIYCDANQSLQPEPAEHKVAL